jgi:hypothetical protein
MGEDNRQSTAEQAAAEKGTDATVSMTSNRPLAFTPIWDEDLEVQQSEEKEVKRKQYQRYENQDGEHELEQPFYQVFQV